MIEPNKNALVVPPYLMFAVAHLGEHEIPGAEDNLHITTWLRGSGVLHPTDETAWCSAFVNACMHDAGIEGTGRANARSWMTWGKALTKPEFGCVVVFKRDPDPKAGHVGFYVGETKATIWALSGNQDNRVSYKEYPKGRLLGYRSAP